MKKFKTLLRWYRKTIEQEMRNVNMRNIRWNKLYCERALCELFEIHSSAIGERFDAILEENDNHDQIGELFHKLFRQVDVVRDWGIDSIIWDLLAGVEIFWDVLARFNRGDKNWDDHYFEWDE